jgi:hypothetical protein
VNEGLDDEYRSELAACAKNLWRRVYTHAMLVTRGDDALAQDVTQSAFAAAIPKWLQPESYGASAHRSMTGF